MSMGSSEGFKEYAQKWRDLAGRVQPPLNDREMVDMFMGTMTGPFFNLLIGSSSSGFTKMVLSGERIESGIKSGKIPMAASSNAEKKPFAGKREANVVYGQKGRNKADNHNQDVRVILVSNSTPTQQHQQGNQHKEVPPKKQFTIINMSLVQVLQHMLKAELIMLKAPM